MNFLGGGERHSRSASCRRTTLRTTDAGIASPGDPLLLGRPGDVRNFIHRRIIGGISGAIGGLVTGNPLAALAGGLRGFVGGGSQASAVPQATTCPPGFVLTASGCQARQPIGALRGAIGGLGVPGGAPLRLGPGRAGDFPQPTEAQADIRTSMGLAVDPAAGVATIGRFGAATEPAVFDQMIRRCPRGAVLAVDGLCYNKRDVSNKERFWPRGRRPLLTGGEVRAISVASSAAKKLERKQKQLMQLGLLKKPSSRRRVAPTGHQAHLHHTGGSEH